jgi:ketosteroid isomerase-like protein
MNTMKDETADILKTFQEYSDTFAQKNACALLRFYGYPALMVDRDEKPEVLSNSIIAAIGLFLEIRKLKKLNYKCSKLHTLEAKQVHQNLAIVSGTATRHDTEGIEFDQFGFTYTLRKTGEYWKIIAGIIHDKEKFLPL